MRKIALPVLLCASVAVTSVGCFGKFALTRKIYDFNQSIDNRFVRSAATWAMVIVPVYAFGGVADFLVFNTIEFWSGSNPLSSRLHGAGRISIVELPDGSATFERDSVMYRLVPCGETTFVVERDGLRIGTAEITEDGGLLVKDAAGELVQGLSAAEVEVRAATATSLAGLAGV